jgi:hypothetical protein
MATNILTKEQRQHLLQRITTRATGLRSAPRQRTMPTAIAKAAALVKAWEADQSAAYSKRQQEIQAAQTKATAAVEFPTSREAAVRAVEAFEAKAI